MGRVVLLEWFNRNLVYKTAAQSWPAVHSEETGAEHAASQGTLGQLNLILVLSAFIRFH